MWERKHLLFSRVGSAVIKSNEKKRSGTILELSFNRDWKVVVIGNKNGEKVNSER